MSSVHEQPTDLHAVTFREATYDADKPVSLPDAVAFCWPQDFPTPSSAKKGVRKGLFTVNGASKKAKCGHHIKPGDRIKRKIPRGDNFKKHAPPATLKTSQPLQVAWIDPMLAVVVKPHGVNVGNHRDDDNSMHQLLLFSISPSTGAFPLRRPAPVHRIDKATYGLLIVARTQNAARDLSTAFESRRLTKRYRAIVEGSLQGQSGFVESPLSGKKCQSEWRVVKHFTMPQAAQAKGMEMTLLDLFPHTGRTHQLRRHMLSIGHPIIGDTEYGWKRTNDAVAEYLTWMGGAAALPLMLAAVDLTFPHPTFTTKTSCAAAACVSEKVSEEESSSKGFVHAECESKLDEDQGTLRVQIAMPSAMRMVLDISSTGEEASKNKDPLVSASLSS